MTREETLSFYINRGIKELRSQLETTNAVDMIPLFGNALFDLSCKLTVDQDLGAINPHGKIHHSVDILYQAIKWLYIIVTLRRLPRIISYHLELMLLGR